MYLDGNPIAMLNSTGVLQWQKVYVSPELLAGIHVAQFKYVGGGGAYIDLDAIQILGNAPGAGVYDDTDGNWSYTGSWLVYNGTAPYASNTTRYTANVGDMASFIFSGTQFNLTYTQAPNRGNIGVYVDGSQVATINATGTLGWQKVYSSPAFSAGTHVVQFKHAGGGGAYIDVDAIQTN